MKNWGGGYAGAKTDQALPESTSMLDVRKFARQKRICLFIESLGRN